ncbi:MAG: xanthine dehydrogenase accessory protein XdhC [Boseongicola sp.]|nr:xanthine dehydrogenase accessory protein XdhC [Boseongicola sp.]MDD9979643.1 xanthine dehydrogenase accessory protein XdhC [Boseongicola sp.]
MTFALDHLRQMAKSGPVARVVVAGVQGSVPREVGASMTVTEKEVIGTIGGGTLEFEAIKSARELLAKGQSRLDRLPLGPGLGQCCGGAVTLLTEIWSQQSLDDISSNVIARALPETTGGMPLALSRILARHRAEGKIPDSGIVDGWMIEPISPPTRDIWVWGAGHVGRALVNVLQPLPDVQIFWGDFDQSRFPDIIESSTKKLVAENPADLVSLASDHAEHLIVTYSHALDLELCHRLLSRPFRSIGLIGSATKWARFRSRLQALGHSDAQIQRIQCPIGDPSLGKHPQAIALGVASAIVREGAVALDLTKDHA